MKARASLVAVAAAALLLGGGGIALALGQATPVTAASEVVIELGNYGDPLKKCLSADKPEARYACGNALIRTAVDNRDFGQALALQRSAIEHDPEAFVGPCHADAHWLGEEIARAGMPYEEAYRIPFADCRYGFYHGALSANLESLDFDGVRAGLNEYCAYFGDPLLDPSQECIHVTGHFLVDRSDGDVRKALDACTEYAVPASYERCVAGVIMQLIFLMTYSAEVPEAEAEAYAEKVWGSREAGARLLPELCREIREDAQGPCVSRLALMWDSVWPGEWARMGEECATYADVTWRHNCYEGILAVPLNKGVWDPVKLTEVCAALTEEGEDRCVRSLAITIGTQLPDVALGDVCGGVPDRLARECQEWLDEGRAIRDRMAGYTQQS